MYRKVVAWGVNKSEFIPRPKIHTSPLLVRDLINEKTDVVQATQAVSRGSATTTPGVHFHRANSHALSSRRDLQIDRLSQQVCSSRKYASEKWHSMYVLLFVADTGKMGMKQP